MIEKNSYIHDMILTITCQNTTFANSAYLNQTSSQKQLIFCIGNVFLYSISNWEWVGTILQYVW